MRWTPLQTSQPATPRLPSSPSPRLQSTSPPSTPPRLPSTSPRPLSPDPPSSDPDADSGRNGLRGDRYPPTVLPKMRNALEFIRLVKEATLESQFTTKELAELLEPQEHLSPPPDDPSLKLSLLNYISFMGCSQDMYEAARRNANECFPNIELLSHYRIERQARILSGVITWEHHMCVKSCVGFTGPFALLERCPECGECRYEEKDLEESDGERKVPRKVFTTFPVGPQLQARWKHSQTVLGFFASTQ